MSQPIEGRVAAILDEYHLIINVGSAHGVKEGMRFVIYAQGADVKDPDTGQPLGKWEFPKGTVKAKHVQEKMTVCASEAAAPGEKPAETSTRVLSADMISVSMREQILQQTQAQKLDVNRAQMEGLPEIGPITVGDRVRSL
jgi:hypothetical protein